MTCFQSIKPKQGKPLVILFGLMISACGVQTYEPTTTALSTNTPSPSLTATITPKPPRPTPTLSPTVLVPTSTPEPVVCSPLEGVAIADLDGMIVNQFSPPQQGSDDPHQGVDIAEIDPDFQIALDGLPVHAVMGGWVAGVIEERFPYGNAILVETPLDLFYSDSVVDLQIPTPASPWEEHPSLTCPDAKKPSDWDESRRSLYLIYAHLKEPPSFQVGDAVTCGQPLNTVGSSGNSLNPHLHLELRAGPAGASFESLAHYTGSASPQEMYNYCLWRVSGSFQLLDPMQLFKLNPK